MGVRHQPSSDDGLAPDGLNTEGAECDDDGAQGQQDRTDEAGS